MRGFRDRDFIRTPEGFLFCVVGSTHPPDRIMAYLKYVPRASGGPWSRGGVRFHRALREYSMDALRETLTFLRDYPAYLTYFEAFGTEMSAVPVARVEEHYKPEERLGQMASSTWLDTLEEKALSLARLVAEVSGVPLSELGVTGSILLGIHVPGISDIDLVVYGRENSARVKEAISKALDDRSIEVQRLEGEVARAWCVRKAKIHPLTLEEAKEILGRKWNMGTYEGVRFSIHPVLKEGEAERYGDRIYKPLGEIAVRAEVRDASLAMFLPAIYGVELRRVIEGPGLRELREICSYESLFADVAEEGEEVVAKGKLELVFDKRERSTYYRVLVGSLAGRGEFIKPVKRS
ncbi:MAG TPA: hypothetical protein ENF34_04520 [Candidatus Bathyarchaeota archaeon]|nr:MAG: hypothetical protein DRO60_04625 [Candidatus Bathyarchaeota archaeon]HDJ26559.1 hypothetical protein [Candidatus Bathyarchaeota archaeon]